MTEADLEVPGWKVRLEDQVGGVIAQGREFRRKSRFGTWGGVGNVELTMYIKEKRICFSVQIKLLLSANKDKGSCNGAYLLFGGCFCISLSVRWYLILP